MIQLLECPIPRLIQSPQDENAGSLLLQARGFTVTMKNWEVVSRYHSYWGEWTKDYYEWHHSGRTR